LLKLPADKDTPQKQQNYAEAFQSIRNVPNPLTKNIFIQKLFERIKKDQQLVEGLQTSWKEFYKIIEDFNKLEEPNQIQTSFEQATTKLKVLQAYIKTLKTITGELRN